MRISDDQALAALVRQNFDLFLRFAFAEIGGGREYLHNWHIDAIIHQLDRIRAGDNKRLVVTVPPRHLKSVTISTAWVAWMLGHDPSLRIICVSYGYDLAEKHARDCMRIMQSHWYRLAFPKVKLVRRGVMDFETSRGGGRLSTSVGGVVTGRGAHIIILDDPMKGDDALSEAAREYVKEWYSNVLVSRLDDQERSSIILVMQRLHDADLAGELLGRGGWHELRLSAIATHDELVPLTRGRFHHRRADHPLHAARQSRAILLQRRAEDPYVFAAQYQQEPVSRIGNFVKRQWFGTYDEPPAIGVVAQSWDTAVKTTVRSDWSVGITARFYQGRFYILDVFRKRVEFGELRRTLCELCARYSVTRLHIEDASSGQQLIQQLREDAPANVPRPIAVRSATDKIARFEAQASKIQAGVVVLPRTAPWLADFVSEVIGFPNARHDDQADALAQLLANPPLEINPTPNAAPEIVDAYSLQTASERSDYDPWGA